MTLKGRSLCLRLRAGYKCLEPFDISSRAGRRSGTGDRSSILLACRTCFSQIPGCRASEVVVASVRQSAMRMGILGQISGGLFEYLRQNVGGGWCLFECPSIVGPTQATRPGPRYPGREASGSGEVGFGLQSSLPFVSCFSPRCGN